MAIARVQSTTANTGAPTTATSLAITFGAATTSGNTVVVAIATQVIVNIKVTSAHGNFYQALPAFDGTGANETVFLFYGLMTGADTVLTIAAANGGVIAPMAAVAAEYSGASIVPDAIPSPIGASATNAANTGNLANINANALFVGVIGVKTQSSTQNTTWATNNVAPFSIVAQTSTNNGTTTTIDRAIAYLDAVVATSATRGANVNHGFGTNRYAGLLATFDQVAAGGGIRAAGTGGLAV